VKSQKSLLIGQFTDAFIPVLDGVSLTVKNYAEELTKNGCYVYVVTPSFPGYQDFERFSVIRYFSVPVPIRKPYRAGIPELDPGIYRKIRNIPFSLVHVHSPFSAAKLGLYSGRQSDCPVIATFHSKYKDDLTRAIPNDAIVRHILSRIVRFFETADEVWVPQAGAAETLHQYGYRGKTVIVPNGTDMGNIPDLNLFRQNTPLRLIGGKKKILLYVGQLILEKNLLFLIESLRHIKYPDFVLWIVGEGYAREDLELLVSKYHLEQKVFFKGPVKERRALEEIYASADLFLFPSLYDNAPLVVREAASVGTPSLLLVGSTAAEIIKENVNGFLSTYNPESYAEKIDFVLSNDLLRQRVGFHASQTLSKPWKNIADEVKERYASLIRRKEGSWHYINERDTSFRNFSSRSRAIRLTTVRLISSSTGRLGS